MLVLRPVELTDLPQLQQLARDSLVGVTSLPDDSERLREKILDSCASFDKDVQGNGPENYFFVLEDLASQRLTGCSEILATAGFSEPFYSLRNRHFTSTSGAEHRARRAGAVVVPRPQRPHLAARLSH